MPAVGTVSWGNGEDLGDWRRAGGRAAGAPEREHMEASTGAASPEPHAPSWPQGLCWVGEGSPG